MPTILLKVAQTLSLAVHPTAIALVYTCHLPTFPKVITLAFNCVFLFLFFKLPSYPLFLPLLRKSIQCLEIKAKAVQ